MRLSIFISTVFIFFLTSPAIAQNETEQETDKIKPVSISFISEITAHPPLQYDGTSEIDKQAIRTISNLVEALNNNPEINLTISLPPATLSSLSHSKIKENENLLLELKNLAKKQLHIISSPFVTSDPESWRLINSFENYNDLLKRGDLQITNQLQIQPDRSFAFISKSAVIETLEVLSKLGIKNFITENSHIDPKPNNETNPLINLKNQKGEKFDVLFSDSKINSYLNGIENNSTDVEDLVTNLSSLLMNKSAEEKNVIVKIPFNVSAETLNKIFESFTTISNLRIKPLPSLVENLNQENLSDNNEYFLWKTAATHLTEIAPAQNLAKAAIYAYSEVIGSPHPNTSFLYELLATTSAAELVEEQISSYYKTIYEEIVKIIDSFTSPKNQNVRLTSRKAELPFTLINNLTHEANVSLILQSDGRISFPEGQTFEVKLNPGTNKIKIPVSSRTSGNSQIRIGVRSPDKNHLLQLDSNSLSITTTRLSGVGILLFVGAVFFLAFWWLRSRRLRSINK